MKQGKPVHVAAKLCHVAGAHAVRLFCLDEFLGGRSHSSRGDDALDDMETALVIEASCNGS